MRPRRSAGESGQVAVVVVMAVTVVAMLIGVAMIRGAMTAATVAANHRNGTAAFHLVMAGVAEVNYLMERPGAPSEGSVAESLGPGSFAASWSGSTVSSTGTAGGVTRREIADSLEIRGIAGGLRRLLAALTPTPAYAGAPQSRRVVAPAFFTIPVFSDSTVKIVQSPVVVRNLLPRPASAIAIYAKNGDSKPNAVDVGPEGVTLSGGIVRDRGDVKLTGSSCAAIPGGCAVAATPVPFPRFDFDGIGPNSFKSRAIAARYQDWKNTYFKADDPQSRCAAYKKGDTQKCWDDFVIANNGTIGPGLFYVEDNKLELKTLKDKGRDIYYNVTGTIVVFERGAKDVEGDLKFETGPYTHTATLPGNQGDPAFAVGGDFKTHLGSMDGNVLIRGMIYALAGSETSTQSDRGIKLHDTDTPKRPYSLRVWGVLISRGVIELKGSVTVETTTDHLLRVSPSLTAASRAAVRNITIMLAGR